MARKGFSSLQPGANLCKWPVDDMGVIICTEDNCAGPNIAEILVYLENREDGNTGVEDRLFAQQLDEAVNYIVANNLPIPGAGPGAELDGARRTVLLEVFGNNTPFIGPDVIRPVAGKGIPLINQVSPTLQRPQAGYAQRNKVDRARAATFAARVAQPPPLVDNTAASSASASETAARPAAVNVGKGGKALPIFKGAEKTGKGPTGPAKGFVTRPGATPLQEKGQGPSASETTGPSPKGAPTILGQGLHPTTFGQGLQPTPIIEYPAGSSSSSSAPAHKAGAYVHMERWVPTTTGNAGDFRRIAELVRSDVPPTNVPEEGYMYNHPGSTMAEQFIHEQGEATLAHIDRAFNMGRSSSPAALSHVAAPRSTPFVAAQPATFGGLIPPQSAYMPPPPPPIGPGKGPLPPPSASVTVKGGKWTPEGKGKGKGSKPHNRWVDNAGWNSYTNYGWPR
jgi:hypothetical protein